MEQIKTNSINGNPKRSEDANKFLAGMDIVHEKLIAFKKKMNSELVYSVNGKIIRIKP
ncbi:MAG: hypothetical protein WCL56_11815 [Sediminibacterium sp.]